MRNLMLNAFVARGLEFRSYERQSSCVAIAEPVKTQDEEDVNKNRKTKKRFASSWDAKQAGAEEGTKADYLSNLGQAQEYNINVTHGAALASSLAAQASNSKSCFMSLASLAYLTAVSIDALVVTMHAQQRLLMRMCYRPEQQDD